MLKISDVEGAMSADATTANPVHHVELWTHDLAQVTPGWDWLFAQLGWHVQQDPDWPQGRTWHHASGVYVVLEQSPAVVGENHDRLRPGLNHLALRVVGGEAGDADTARAALDRIRSSAPTNGWSELFADRYPHAGGPDHTAVFLENSQGFEVELVAEG
jgi:hypothetical protein